MKLKFIASLLLVIASQSFANTVESVYQKESILPPALKAAVLETLTRQCAGGISSYGLTETITVLKAETLTNGLLVRNYTTQLQSRYYFDGMHPSNQLIEVNSSEIISSKVEDSKVEVNSFVAQCEQGL